MSVPKLIVLSGLPGTGKSTLAEKIAEQLQLPIFSVDPIESAIIKAGIKKSFETGLAAYMVAETLAREHIKLGNSVIIDAVNAEDEGKQVWVDCARRLKVPLVVIECILKDENLHRERIEARVRGLHGIDEITWDKVQERRKKYTDWKIDVLSIEMSNDIENNLRTVLDFIAQHP